MYDLLKDRVAELEKRLGDGVPITLPEKGRIIGNIAKYRAVIALERIAEELEKRGLT